MSNTPWANFRITMDVSTVRLSSLAHSHFAASTTCPSTVEINRQFLKTAAQELNNPITTIKTALTLLNSSTLKAKQRERYLQMIGQACDRQSHLIKGVFELLELQLTPPVAALEKVQLLDLVPGVVSTYQPLAIENNISLTYTVSDNLTPISAIRVYLKQVLVSLLSNSIRFTKEDGRIDVTAHQRGDSKIALIIRDNGCGIARTALPQIFDSFYCGASKGSNAGLGLTLARQLLTHCNASISASSTPGQGSTFTILLEAVSE